MKSRTILKKINSPKDLKRLSSKELDGLAREIREFLLSHVSKTGGHLASNLGVVELTIALHRFLECPKDQLVWDVGHQSYVHKILTGRRKHFPNLRQRKGISGFPKISESQYDVFGAGHASTSLSAALGIAEAKFKEGGSCRVVTVIGDGALTGGMALEAINHIGYLQTKLTIILNDNRMSIAENVGALSRYTRRIEKTETYQSVKKEITGLITAAKQQDAKYLPSLKALKTALKQVGTPGLLFEKLGINYVGPVDGHSFYDLERALRKSEKINGPVLIHVRTKKGMGYALAEQCADKFHGVSPFSIETGKSNKKSDAVTFSDTLGRTLLPLAKKDRRIIAITAAMPSGTGLSGFANELPNQFYDVGICEQHAVTFAAGLARAGMKPIVAVYSTFLQRGYDQIIHDVCLQNLPVIFAVDRAGLVGEDGPTHHGVFDISYLRHIPNLIVMAPENTAELESMLKLALSLKKPIAIRYPRGADEELSLEKLAKMTGQKIKRSSMVKLACAEFLCHGKDAVLVALGNQLERAVRFALKKKLSATIVNARFAKPIDPRIIREIKKTGRAIILEENVKAGGFGSAVLEELARKKISAKTTLVGVCDDFIEHGSCQELRDLYIK